MTNKKWKPEAAESLDAMLTRILERRAAVEQELLDMANGKEPMPDTLKLRQLARALGDPTSKEAMSIQIAAQG